MKRLTQILVTVLVIGTVIYSVYLLFNAFQPPENKIIPELLEKEGEVYVWVDLTFPSNPLTVSKLQERGLEPRYVRYGNLRLSGRVDASKLEDIASAFEVSYVDEARYIHLIGHKEISYVKEKLRIDNVDETGRGVTVGVVDTGTECDKLSNFNGICVYYKCQSGVCKPANSVDDWIGHGTAVAETMTLIAPDIEKIIVLQTTERIERKGRPDDYRITGDAVVAAIEKATELNVDIIQISLGYRQRDKQREKRAPENVAVMNAIDSGIVVSISAGNSGPGGRSSCRVSKDPSGESYSVCCPGCVPRAITSGGLAEVDKITGFSSRGPSVFGVKKPDITTFGCIKRIGGVGQMDVDLCGTSFSAPTTSGIIALMLEANPNLTPPQVRVALLSTTADLGFPCWDNIYGTGRAQADLAVIYTENPTSSLLLGIKNILT